jgi:hypothetical protein
MRALLPTLTPEVFVQIFHKACASEDGRRLIHRAVFRERAYPELMQTTLLMAAELTVRQQLEPCELTADEGALLHQMCADFYQTALSGKFGKAQLYSTARSAGVFHWRAL